MSYPGKYYVIEGADGTGKSTQTLLLEEYLKQRGHDVLAVREPGGTIIGEKVRAILRDPSLSEMTPITESCLLFASRAQLYGEIIVPALKQGKIVLTDRCKFSTDAYQGEAGGMGLEPVEYMGNYLLSTYGIKIDGGVVILPDDSLLEELLEEEKHIDRYHQKPLEFHLKVNEAYRRIARENNLKIIQYIRGKRGEEEKAVMQMQEQIRRHFDSMLINTT